MDKYIGTTASELDHYFGNEVGIVRLWHLEGMIKSKDVNAQRDEFIAGLESTLERADLREYGGVTKEHLREMIQLAKSCDWSNIESIKRLYRRKFEIRKKEYNEEEIFG